MLKRLLLVLLVLLLLLRCWPTHRFASGSADAKLKFWDFDLVKQPASTVSGPQVCYA